MMILANLTTCGGYNRLPCHHVPYTGFDIIPVVIIGILLVGAGIALRMITHRNARP